MKIESALSLILSELARAEKLHPAWPNNLIHASAILAEESGEVTKAVLDHNEHKGSKAHIITEAVHTAAMALRFLKNINDEDNSNE